MFPTTHDITINNVDEVINFLIPWLECGNEFLIVSKPDHLAMTKLLKWLEPWKEQITLRFTIGSSDEKVLAFWEPEAPTFKSRLASLIYAFERGWKTSVSCEPYLDYSIHQLVFDLLPYITDSIWVGKMNEIDRRVDTEGWQDSDYKHLSEVRRVSTDSHVRALYGVFKDNPKVKWKDSIRKVMGLDAQEVG